MEELRRRAYRKMVVGEKEEEGEEGGGGGEVNKRTYLHSPWGVNLLWWWAMATVAAVR